MHTLTVTEDKRGRLIVLENEATLQGIIDLVDSHFVAMPRNIRHERIVIQGPIGVEPPGLLYIGMRETTSFLTPTECKIPALRSLAQIIEAATTIKDYNLSKMKLVVPNGRPNELTLHVFS